MKEKERKKEKALSFYVCAILPYSKRKERKKERKKREAFWPLQLLDTKRTKNPANVKFKLR